MSKQPPASRTGRRKIAATTAVASALLLFASLAWAQGDEGTTPENSGRAPLINDVSGHVSLSYFYSGTKGENVKYGGREGVLRGLTLGAGLSFALAEYEFALQADGLSPSRQNLTLTVENDEYTGKLSFENIPPPTANDDRSLDFTVSNSLRLDGLPGASLNLGYRSGSGDRSHLSLTTSISDSYRDVSPELENLRWQIGYRLSAASRAGDDSGYRHGTRLRLSGAVTESERPEVTFRPSVSARFDWDLSDDNEFEHAYDISVDASSPDRGESLDLDLGLDFDQGGEIESDQAISYTTSRLGPFDLNGSVSFEQGDDDRAADYRMGLGFDLGRNLQASGGYHGRSTSDGVSNGAEASLQYRLSVRPWYLSARADGDLQFLAGGGIEPSSRVSLNMRYRGEPLSASATGYLRFDGERLSGRAEVSGDYEGESTGISVAGGLLLSRDVSTNVEFSGRRRIAGGLSIQGQAGYRAKFADDTDSVFTLGLGLRYDVGGER